MTLEEFIVENRLRVDFIADSVCKIEEDIFILIKVKKDNILIDENFNFIITKIEKELSDKYKATQFLFEFGGKYYHSPIKFSDKGTVKVILNDFKYLGKALQTIEEPFCHLGVHTEYELMNGSHNPKDWVKKAKFLNHNSLGICEENTLAGTLAFQLACDDNGVKPIIGMTAVVLYDKTTKNEKYRIKLYAVDKIGWKNLLRINKEINVENNGEFIKENILLKYTSGLILVFPKESIINYKDTKLSRKIIKLYHSYFDSIYYQIDSVKYDHIDHDKPNLISISNYLNYLSDILPPVLINDSYYLDKEEAEMKRGLNNIVKKPKPTCNDQYYKTLDDSKEMLEPLFEEDKKFKNGLTYYEILYTSIINTMVISDTCEFKIDTGKHKLPAYEHDLGISNKELFYDILDQGIENKLNGKVKNIDKYMFRLQEEMEVIVNAGFIDYFLILWDIVKWAKTNGIYVGSGRGSVGGSLVAYLMDIITIDPIEYDLLFERFLNKTRISGERAKSADAMPDVDIDFEAARKDEVKKYMESKYSKDHVCSIGSYVRMKLKGCIKDFGRIEGMRFNQVNFITSKIPNTIGLDEWINLFKNAKQDKELKKFIQENPNLINNIKFALNQSKASSVHASAVVIVPKHDEDGEEMTIYDWLPVKKIKDDQGEHLISEWEGKYMERAGFLKEDILGLTQLDKFKGMIELIKTNRGKKIILEEIPKTDKKVFQLFHKGLTEEVFQFGSAGLKKYSKQAKPNNIEDIIAMNALYRPGPMESDAHNDFVLIKNGKKKAKYDYGLQSVTEKTFGLYVYQEQIMKAVNVLGGLSLSEADEVRTIMKKFDKKKMATFEDKFIEGAKKNGCPQKEAKLIWGKLEKFSGYGFNKSHSAAYGLMAYQSQWLKANFPAEFFAISLNNIKATNNVSLINIANIINEMYKICDVKLKSTNINFSNETFYYHLNSNFIYWSISRIKGIGSKTADKLLSDRRSNGKYDSLSNFMKRMKAIKFLRKNMISGLILSGAFDELEKLKEVKDRKLLIEKLYDFIDEEMPLIYESSKYTKNHNWLLLERETTGYANLDLKKIIANKSVSMSRQYIEVDDFETAKDFTKAAVAGTIVTFMKRKSVRGDFGQIMLLSNTKVIFLTIWNDKWEEYKKEVELAKKEQTLVCFTGIIKKDSYREENVLYSDSLTTKMITL